MHEMYVLQRQVNGLNEMMPLAKSTKPHVSTRMHFSNPYSTLSTEQGIPLPLPRVFEAHMELQEAQNSDSGSPEPSNLNPKPTTLHPSPLQP